MRPGTAREDDGLRGIEDPPGLRMNEKNPGRIIDGGTKP
jgi:hypothetical protein